MQTKKNKENKGITNPFYRGVILAIGWLSTTLGIIGIFIPLLPTTPFLLLAAVCFLRSSPKSYAWLIRHPTLGKYITNYLEGKGITLTAKITSITAMSLAVAFSIYFFISNSWIIALLVLITLGVSIYLIQLPTLRFTQTSKEKDKVEKNE